MPQIRLWRSAVLKRFSHLAPSSLWRFRAGITAVAMGVLSANLWAANTAAVRAPAKLTCDSLVEPLGLDDAQPRLSWQLRDSRQGARQTAYQIQVASKQQLLAGGKADVWDSGKIESDRSVGVTYSGPALDAEKRYYWRVKVWDKNGKPYPISEASWWETGLMSAAQWQAKWIGYETSEEEHIREAGAVWITNPETQSASGTPTRHDFRFGFALPSPVKRAVLYVTGRDTPAAWINGQPVLQATPLPPWKQFAWKRYQSVEVTSALRSGSNLLAVEILSYSGRNAAGSYPGQTPMSASLYLEMSDGTVSVLKSSPSWKAQLEAANGWQQTSFDDAKWAAAIPFISPAGSAGDTEPANPWPTGPVKILRKGFDVSSPVVSARLYVTALGAYQVSINGKRVGDQVLSPGWMDYREHVAYQAYDVTRLLKPGRNVIGAYLAAGWYATPLMWWGQAFNYGDTPPAMKGQLRVEHADGSIEWIATDASWKANVSAIAKAEIYDGEDYDARRVIPGWDTASYAAEDWKPVEIVDPKEPEIVAQYFPPVRVEKTLAAKTVTNPKPGIYIYDFGQNLAGIASIRAQGEAGTNVQLRFAEVLNSDGTIYTDNLRTAKATDHFILDGGSAREYEPKFTFHGFRYVEVTGLQRNPGLAAVKAIVFHTDAPFTAELKTGSSMINQLWQNILWGQRSNFVSVPTDCPQRDERLGWTADAQVFWRTASYNMDLDQFSKKFAADIRGTQVGTTKYGIFAPGTIQPNPGYGAGWSDAGVIIPWTAWLQSGDTTAIAENWEAMQSYLRDIAADNPDYLWKKNYGTPYGDWLSPEGPTSEVLVATAYWAYDVTLMREMAHALGKSEDEARYAELYHNIQLAFAKEFVRADGFIAGADNGPSPFGQLNNPNAKSKGGDTQTSYVLALEMGLVPESLRQVAADKLVDKIKANNWLLGTGFLGTPYLLAVLVDTGHSDVAYRLLLNTSYPSWGYLVAHGATTMWERWNGDQMRNDPGMNSYNHYAYGAVADWIYRYAAGVDASAADAGFHAVSLHPTFDSRLGSIDFAYDSPYGKIQSAWTVHGTKVTWKVVVPANATGWLPETWTEGKHISLDGTELGKSRIAEPGTDPDGVQAYKLNAGTYQFEIDTK
jgi:alpha-L-rhamnosidase